MQWLARGDCARVCELSPDTVEGDRFVGGFAIRTSRENPAESPEKLRDVGNGLKLLGISDLIMMGGDDTALTVLK